MAPKYAIWHKIPYIFIYTCKQIPPSMKDETNDDRRQEQNDYYYHTAVISKGRDNARTGMGIYAVDHIGTSQKSTATQLPVVFPSPRAHQQVYEYVTDCIYIHPYIIPGIIYQVYTRYHTSYLGQAQTLICPTLISVLNIFFLCYVQRPSIFSSTYIKYVYFHCVLQVSC